MRGLKPCHSRCGGPSGVVRFVLASSSATISLVHGATGMSLWGENYIGAWDELFDLQRRTVASLLEEVEAYRSRRTRKPATPRDEKGLWGRP